MPSDMYAGCRKFAVCAEWHYAECCGAQLRPCVTQRTKIMEAKVVGFEEKKRINQGENKEEDNIQK